jgi:hypothetical protein
LSFRSVAYVIFSRGWAWVVIGVLLVDLV